MDKKTLTIDSLMDIEQKDERFFGHTGENIRLSSTGCISPKEVVGAKRQTVAEMFGSHDWVVDGTKTFGTEGVLLHYHCSRCSAEGFSTIINKG